jgi:zinc transport system substrate-binding protein
MQFVSARSIDKITIFVSISPQKFLVERIGGDRVIVTVMVGPGQNPATYEPTPKKMTKLSAADVYFQIGVPFEDVWVDVISETSDALRMVTCCESIMDRELEGHTHGQIGMHAVHDPHVWTSPRKTKEIARQIFNVLTALDPLSKEYYLDNYNRLIVNLEKLDAGIRERLQAINIRYLIVSHPSWGYYADAYDLVQVPIEQQGKEIQAKALVELVRFARKEKIRTVFVQKQFNHAAAEILAREINARIIELDPLAENYIENLDFVTNEIIRGSR